MQETAEAAEEALITPEWGNAVTALEDAVIDSLLSQDKFMVKFKQDMKPVTCDLPPELSDSHKDLDNIVYALSEIYLAVYMDHGGDIHNQLLRIRPKQSFPNPPAPPISMRKVCIPPIVP